MCWGMRVSREPLCSRCHFNCLCGFGFTHSFFFLSIYWVPSLLSPFIPRQHRVVARSLDAGVKLLLLNIGSTTY